MALKCWVVSSEKDWAISDSCEQNRNNRIHKMLGQGLITGTILVAFPVKTELILTQFIRKKKWRSLWEVLKVIFSIPDNFLGRSTGICFCCIPLIFVHGLTLEIEDLVHKQGLELEITFLIHPVAWANICDVLRTKWNKVMAFQIK